MHTKTFQLPVITDDDHVRAIEDELLEIEGVRKAQGHCMTKIFAVEYDEPEDWDTIEKTLLSMGYTPKYR